MTQSLLFDLEDSVRFRALLFTGSRYWSDESPVRSVLLASKPSLIVHGGAPGLDSIVASLALELGVPTRVFPADWTLGKKAGPLRNQEMVEFIKIQRYPCFYAFHESLSLGKGTRDTVVRCMKARVPGTIFFPTPPPCDRASGDVVCKCGLEYRQHPNVQGGLVWGCGRIWKL